MLFFILLKPVRATLIFLILCTSLNSFGQNIDSLNTVLRSTKHDTVKLSAYVSLGKSYERSNLDSSLSYFQRALDISQEIAHEYPTYEPNVLHQIGLAFGNLRMRDTAIVVLNKAITIQKERGLKKQLAETQFDLGSIYQSMSDFRTAILYYDAVINRNLADKTDYYLATSCNYSGLCSYYLRKLEPASERILQAIRYTKELEDTTEIHRPYMVYGLIMKERKQYEEAKKYIKLSTEIATTVDNKVRAALGHKNLGDALALQDSLDAALATYRRAFEVYSEINNSYGVANYYNNVAYIELKRNNYWVAHENLEICLEKLSPATAPKSRADVLRKLADAKVKLANNDFVNQNATRKAYLRGAIEVGETAWEMVEPIAATNVQLDVALVLIEAYQSLGMLSEALDYSIKARELSNAINDQAIADAIARMTTEFETERIEDENNLLQETQRRQSAQLKQQRSLMVAALVVLLLIAVITIIIQRNRVKLKKANVTVEKSLEEKELLLKEIHHRVKNNLQVVSSLLDLQSRGIEDEKALSTFMEGQNRVKAMALIHQKLYQNEDLATIDFTEYAQQLLTELATIYKGAEEVKTVVKSSENAQFDIDTAIPLGLILNELISNAYKYAFNGGEGSLNVSIESLGSGKHQLIVRDSGQGLPADFDLTKAKSLGLRLVRRLSKQLYGSAEYYYEQGSKFIITFTDTLERRAV